MHELIGLRHEVVEPEIKVVEQDQQLRAEQDVEAAQILIEELTGRPPVLLAPIVNGRVNTVFMAATHDAGKLVVRMSRDTNAIDNYTRSDAARNLVAPLGIPVSQTLHIGNTLVPYAYMLESQTEGMTVNFYHGDKDPVWEQVGAYARRFNEIGFPHFGPDFHQSSDIQPQNWADFTRQRINRALDPQYSSRWQLLDPLRVQNAISEVATWNPTPRLVHFDLLNEGNILVNSQGQVTGIIDWDNAGASIAPIAEISGRDHMDETVQNAFLRGYGLSPDEATYVKNCAKPFLLVGTIGYIKYALELGDMQEVQRAELQAFELLESMGPYAGLLETA